MSRKVVVRKQANLLGLLKQTSSLTTSLRHLSSSPPAEHPIPTPLITENRSNPSSSGEEELLNLLRSIDHDNWKQEDLLKLTPSISSPRLPLLLRRLDTSAKAINFFKWIHNNSPSLLPQSHSILYQAIFEVAAKETNSHLRLLEIFRTSKAHKVALTPNSATLLIRHFSRAHMITESLDVFNNVDPSVKDTHLYNTLLDVLYHSNRFVDARKLLDEMLHPESPFAPNALTGSVVFSALVMTNQPGDEVIDLVSKLSEYGVFPDASMLTKLITKLSKSCDTDKAWGLLHLMIKMSASVVEVTSINAMLVGLGRENKFKNMNLLLAEMKEIGIGPNRKTFEILIYQLCKSRRVDEALAVLDNMKERQDESGTATADIITYNQIMKALCIVGRLDDSLALVDKMRSQHGYAPNIVTYNALLNGFCKVGEIERSLKLFDQMKEEGVTPDVITLNTLVDGMCKHGRTSSAIEFFNNMRKKGLKGNAITYTSLISAFCNVNNLDKATNLFDEMVSSHCTPDSIVYYTLINGFTRAGRLDDAWSVVSKMKNAGFALDAVSYNVLISGFCKKKKLDKVYELIKEMEISGIKPDQITYNTLIASLSKSGDFSTVHLLMKKMRDQGLFPTVVTYGALIHGYCKAGKLEEALGFFSLMSSTTKVPPNTVIYNILIDSLCKEKKIKDALTLMDDMKVKGVSPNVITYNAMFRGLQDMNYLDKALNLMDDMNKLTINPDYVTMEILTGWLSAVGEIARLRSFVAGFEVPVSNV